MSNFILQPDVYRTGARHNLSGILEDAWINDIGPGDGTIYVLSGFGNYNGGVRFYSTFRRHIDAGGQVVAIFGGSTSQRLTSRQVIERLLDCGCTVHLVSRKRIFHSKCYGAQTQSGSSLVVTSGNFTGPGMTQNVESTVYLKPDITSQLQFQWDLLFQSIMAQRWDIYRPVLTNPGDPAWQLLYDERESGISVEEAQLMTMVLTLGHADTVRINASRGSVEGLGSQYFWLSKDCYDFFPPLTILNERGYKTTNSALINLHYVDLGLVMRDTRVTFEAGNNVDFRLGTGKYRYSQLAQPGDIAAISRISEHDYEVRIFRQDTPAFTALFPYATNFIGHRDKKIGFLANDRFEQETGIVLTPDNRFGNLPTRSPD
ncbi:MAG: restriction endonuclease [Candidatus Paceibacterota bacterium]